MTWLRLRVTNEIVRVFHVQEQCTIHISQKGSTYEKELKQTKKKSQSDMPASPVFTKKENATLVQHIEMTSVMATVITSLQALTHERKSMVGQTGTTKWPKPVRNSLPF